jgi:23S rRNA (uracil1939-C5)-methyltransferase
MNFLLQLSVEKLVYGGDGLTRLPADEHGRGKAVFLPFVLEGETVEAELLEQKRSFARGKATKLLWASTRRVEPRCPYFQRCGGCHYQHASYEHQLEIKAAILKENLRRLAKLELGAELQIHASPPWNYRNRTRLKIQTAPEFALGYYELNSHELLPVEQCPISSPLINRAITALWQLGTVGHILPQVQEVEIFADSSDSWLLVELYCTPDAPRSSVRQCAEEVKSALPEAVGVVAFRSSFSTHCPAEPKVPAGTGARELSYNVGDHSYRVSAGAFFQVNGHLTEELVNIVTGSARGGNALDLYAGVGLFSTALAESFSQVIAVEPSPTSFSDLSYNSPANVQAVRATTEQFFKNHAAGLKPDLVVVDPPRTGLGASVVRELAKLRAPRLTYVSCDPATLSRDFAGLLVAGYRIEQAHLIDLFPQTFHLESVFLLAR